MGRSRNLGGWTMLVGVGVLPLAVAFASMFTLGVPLAIAQEDAAIIEDEAAPDEAATPAPSTPAGIADTTDTVPLPRQSYLGWLYESLGLLYTVIFLGLSFALVALFVMNVLMLRRENILPSHLIDNFETFLNAKKYQEAYELAKNDESFLGKVLSAGLARISSGYAHAIEGMQEVGEEENMNLEHRLSYLALIGTISPMFGLLGTVDGMVQAFEVIARSTVSPKPAELADGIATALVTTLVGLWLAIPAIAAFNILRNRMSRLVLEVGVVSENLMSRFQNVGGQKTP
ncbi:MAG: MotA/TolQ/ExbB proton channel family protein [Pirellulales bacterium]